VSNYLRTPPHPQRVPQQLSLDIDISEHTLIVYKVIGSSPNAVRMQKVVSFYEKLPRGAAPEPEAKGLLARYQKKHFGKNASARRAYSSKLVSWPCNGPQTLSVAESDI
jgi:hypothetical protein